MNSQWQMISDKINKLQKRERLLLLLSVFAVCYLIWDLVFFEPLMRQQQYLEQQKFAKESELKSLTQEQAVLLQMLAVDPDAKQKQQIEGLNRQLRALDSELAELEVGLVPAQQLTQILQDVLQQTGGLSLKSIETMPVEPVSLGQKPLVQDDSAIQVTKISDQQGTSLNSTGVFKHAVAITLEGSYFSLLKYLAALEDLPWRFYWEQLHYQVEQHPKSLIELRIYTLSTEKGLLGV